MKTRIIRKLYILSLFLVFALTATSQAYKIKIEIKGAAGLNAQLAYYQGDNKYQKQNTTFDKNNKAIFEGKEKLPTGIYLIIIGNKGYLDILIRNEQNFSIYSDTSDLIRKIKVKDSKENSLFFAYQQKVIDYKDQLAKFELESKRFENQADSLKLIELKKNKLEEELNNLVETTKKNNPDSYLSKILSAMDVQDFEQFNFADEELLRTPFFHNYIRLFIKKNIEKSSVFIINETFKLLDSIKSSTSNFEYMGGYLLNFYNGFYKTGINEVFVAIADKYFLPDKASWLSAGDLEQVKVRRDFLAQSFPGKQAQDLILKSSSGEYISLLQLKSKYTFLYFWSTGCGHCTKSTSILKENYQALTNKGVEIYAVNVDKDEKEWQKKIEENELQWINCIDPDLVSNYRDKYYVYGSPLLYIIDSDKKIIALKNGEIEIEKAIQELIR